MRASLTFNNEEFLYLELNLNLRWYPFSILSQFSVFKCLSCGILSLWYYIIYIMHETVFLFNFTSKDRSRQPTFMQMTVQFYTSHFELDSFAENNEQLFLNKLKILSQCENLGMILSLLADLPSIIQWEWWKIMMMINYYSADSALYGGQSIRVRGHVGSVS